MWHDVMVRVVFIGTQRAGAHLLERNGGSLPRHTLCHRQPLVVDALDRHAREGSIGDAGAHEQGSLHSTTHKLWGTTLMARC